MENDWMVLAYTSNTDWAPRTYHFPGGASEENVRSSVQKDLDSLAMSGKRRIILTRMVGQYDTTQGPKT